MVPPVFSLPPLRIRQSRMQWSLALALTCLAVALPAVSIPAPRNISPRLAQSSTNAPPAALGELLTQIDSAASRRELQTVLQFYSPSFSNSDGLDRQSLEKALSSFWKEYSSLTYRTEINSWQPTQDGFSVETTTTITGNGKVENRPLTLKSTLKSRQQIANGKVLSQEILTEKTQVTAGEKPPTVQSSIPEQVNVGQEYSLDVVVQEPLGNSLLLGTVMEKPIKADAYFKPVAADLDLLNAGGLFKIGKAPAQPGNHWVSVALIRDDGMTLITQRLRVIKP